MIRSVTIFLILAIFLGITLGCSRINVPQTEKYNYKNGDYTQAFSDSENKEISIALSKLSWHSNWVTYAPVFPEITSASCRLIIAGDRLVGSIMDLNSVYCEIPDNLLLLLKKREGKNLIDSDRHTILDSEWSSTAHKVDDQNANFLTQDKFKLIK